MTIAKGPIEIRGDAQTYERHRSERSLALVGTEDDMWATFADLAEPYALIMDQQVVGSCSIDEDHQLHAFHVSHAADEFAPEILSRVVEEMNIAAAMPSTVDPGFLSLCLARGGPVETVALLYELVAEPQVTESVEVHLADSDDLDAAVAFSGIETESQADFLEGYVAQRIDRGELYLLTEADGRLAATGECRIDLRTQRHAHLGLIVGCELRGRGVGTKLMRTLVDIARAKDLSPLCSTEPSNVAAQRVILRAGFRSRHRVFRVGIR